VKGHVDAGHPDVRVGLREGERILTTSKFFFAYGLEHGFNYTIIRPFNFIGPKIDYLLNETDGIPRVFSFFMEALISGTTMKLVDGGHQRRCYTYIEDAVELLRSRRRARKTEPSGTRSEPSWKRA
jgi:nucleoside-diphosphate-sugar epimerase